MYSTARGVGSNPPQMVRRWAAVGGGLRRRVRPRGPLGDATAAAAEAVRAAWRTGRAESPGRDPPPGDNLHTTGWTLGSEPFVTTPQGGGGGHSGSQERLKAGQTGNSQAIVTAFSLHRHEVTLDGVCSQPCDKSASKSPPLPPPRHHLWAGDWGEGPWAGGRGSRPSARGGGATPSRPLAH